MKKILYIFIASALFFSCGDITDLNEDTKNPAEVEPGALLANAQVATHDFMASPNVNLNNFRLWVQFWASVTYTDESNYLLNNRDQPGNMWNTFYSTVIRDLQDAKDLVNADEFLPDNERNAQLAVLDVMQVYAYHVLVDCFGSVPYTEALGESSTPAYDDAEFIYNDLIDRLNTATGNLDGTPVFTDHELVYGGDTDAWRKFANSLKLRLGVRLTDIAPAKAQTVCESAIADGVFESLADDCQIAYEASPPNTNPLWEDLIQSGRTDYIAANTITDVLNDLNDPRSLLYFQAPVDSVTGELLGGIPGANNSYPAFSHAGTIQEDPTWPGELIGFVEVNFLRAHVAEMGWNAGGAAEDFYNAGVTASIMEWGGSEDQAADYLAQDSVAYSTAPGSWQDKIALQKWIAMYDRGFEAWNTYKLYDNLPLKKAAIADMLPPFRYTYPLDEYQLNGSNTQAAADGLGDNGDALTTKIWWDVN